MTDTPCFFSSFFRQRDEKRLPRRHAAFSSYSIIHASGTAVLPTSEGDPRPPCHSYARSTHYSALRAAPIAAQPCNAAVRRTAVDLDTKTN